MYASFPISVFILSDIYSGVELLYYIVVLFLGFYGKSILLFIVAEPIYIPTNCVQGFSFFHILSTCVIHRLLDDSPSHLCQVISYCGFDMHLSND